MRTLEETTELTRPRRPTGRRLILLAIVLAAVAAIVVTGIVANKDVGARAHLRVQAPDVNVNNENGASSIAHDGDDVRSGDEIVTGEGGRAQIDFFDGSLTRLDVSTRVAVERLSDKRSGRVVQISQRGGRTWNRVRELGSSDRFEVGLPGGSAIAKGTIFLADCRRSSECFVVGFDSTTQVTSSSGESLEVGPNQCASLASNGDVTRCDAQKLKLLDGWVRENLAADQQLPLQTIRPTPSPTPSPSPTQVSSPRRFAPVATVRPHLRTPSKTPPPGTPRPKKTTDPDDDGVFKTVPPSPSASS